MPDGILRLWGCMLFSNAPTGADNRIAPGNNTVPFPEKLRPLIFAGACDPLVVAFPMRNPAMRRQIGSVTTGHSPGKNQRSRDSQETERYCFRVLCDYQRLLEHWKTAYAPQPQDAIWHPLFVEALQRISYTEYLLDILLYGEIEEKAALIAAQGKEVLRLEQRISELAAGNAGSGQKDDGHNGTGADTGRKSGNRSKI